MPLHIDTPLLRSTPLSQLTGAEVWLKMDALQPSGSFKLRGMGLACQRAVQAGARQLVSSSGGNAGLAVAVAGRALAVPVTIVVPRRTSELMRARIAAEGAEVLVRGEVWDEAHAHALELARSLGGALIHPFDDPDVWEGHASLMHEVAAKGLVPEVVLVSVGGGGLLCGLLQGMHELGWSEVPVVAVETHGADSYARALAAGGPITRDGIDSIALTLGAQRVAEQAWAWSQRHPIEAVQVSDRAAVQACTRFLNDHRVLVEPACGASLSLLYDRHPLARGRVLTVVCGGAAATPAQLAIWQEKTA